MTDGPAPTVDEALEFLDLEHIDGDLYRGRPGVRPPGRSTIYGGETAAQALRAAAHTVPEGRLPHSLHGYFLRPGDPMLPVLFHVDRNRDGRSFSSRRVAATQRGEVIWEMSCSFTEPIDGPEFVQPARTGLPEPDDCLPTPHPWCPPAEILRAIGPGNQPPVEPWADRLWTRFIGPLPDDPIVHMCLHAFLSDMSAGFGDLGVDGVPPLGPSLDHALWFHHPSRADEWVIWDCVPVKVGSHRGLYTGTAHDRSGGLVATIAQEMLLRPPPPTP
jgi:acyl-CoA thioesterase-2